MKQTNILLSEEQHSFLRKLSYESGKSISEIIRGYVDQFSGLTKAVGPISKESQNTDKPMVTPVQIKDLPGFIAKPLDRSGLVKKRGELNGEDYV